MEDFYRIQFRLPHPLYERLKAEAAKSGRSLNAELVYQLGVALALPQSHANELQPIEVEFIYRLIAKLSAPENRAHLHSIVESIEQAAKGQA